MKKGIWKKLATVFLGGIMFAFSMFGGACGSKKGDDHAEEYDPPEIIIDEDDDSQGGTTKPTVTYTPAKNWGAQPVYSYTFDRIGNDVMPIGGFAGPYKTKVPAYNGQVQPDFLDDYFWQLFKDCGVNNILFTRDEYCEEPASVMRALNQAEKFGMVYFVRDQRLKMEDINEANMSNLASIVGDYINHPGCAGIYGLDEPTTEKFAPLQTLKSSFDALGYNDRSVYINMLPNYAPDSAFGMTNGKRNTYEQYLSTYMQQVKMPYLMYDYYPFVMGSNALDLDKNSRIVPYFENISVARKVANQYQAPFWAFVQAGGQWEGEGGKPVATEYPLFPSESSFLWNINTLLAYGMKGMGYFDLIQEILPEINFAETPDGGRDYTRFGIVGGLGNINQWYYYAKKAATQIQAIDGVLMNASSQGIIATGSRAYMVGNGEEVFTNGSWRELKSVVADNAIVGCFDYQGRTALYVVNNSFDQKQKITLKFDDKYGYDVTQRGQKVSVATENLQLTVEAGEGVLVVLRAK